MSKRTPKPQIKYVPTEKIHPYEKNPRINDDAVEGVAKSLTEFGWQQPIVVDTNNVIIVGHTRWKAAQILEMDKVPVIVARDLSPEQIKSYRLVDNRTGELASWNTELLSIEVESLRDLGADLGLTGFAEYELQELGASTEGAGETTGRGKLSDGTALKQIYLFFSADDYEYVVSALFRTGIELSIETNSDIVMALLERWEGQQQC